MAVFFPVEYSSLLSNQGGNLTMTLGDLGSPNSKVEEKFSKLQIAKANKTKLLFNTMEYQNGN
ncbi:hypothetical protein ACTXT7_013620, partial [Hymenolepis weldensis]